MKNHGSGALVKVTPSLPIGLMMVIDFPRGMITDLKEQKLLLLLVLLM